MLSSTQLHDLVDRFVHDMLLEVVTTSERSWWLKRAEEFDAARPRPGDFPGQRTVEQRRAKWRELTEIANACRARAEVAHIDDLREDVAAVLREVA